jgi:hypothetical protein
MANHSRQEVAEAAVVAAAVQHVRRPIERALARDDHVAGAEETDRGTGDRALHARDDRFRHAGHDLSDVGEGDGRPSPLCMRCAGVISS